MDPMRNYSLMENTIGDLKISTVLDQGFFQMFGMSPELHSHSYYELLFPLDDGLGVELAQGEIKRVETGTFCLIPPGIYHGTRSIEEGSRKLAIRFRYARHTEGDKEASVYEQFHKALSACGGLSVFSCGEEMRAAVVLIRKELEGKQIASEEYLKAVRTQLYICLLRSLSEQNDEENGARKDSGAQDDREQRRIWIEEYFQQYYAQPITEDHMAQRMNLSRRQVSRVLKEIYGKSFRQRLIEERLWRASQLLVTTKLSVEEIAAAVGYTSQSGFYSAFMQTFGVSAGQYRKEFRKI